MSEKQINAERPQSWTDVICNEEDCWWRRECANHATAGDFRSEDGTRPKLHLRKGKVFCETFNCPPAGEDTEFPSVAAGIGAVRCDELKEDN